MFQVYEVGWLPAKGVVLFILLFEEVNHLLPTLLAVRKGDIGLDDYCMVVLCAHDGQQGMHDVSG